MPGSDTGHLTQTAMGFAGELLCVPTAGHTWRDERFFSLYRLALLAGPVNLVGGSAAVQLHLHQVRLLLPHGQQTHLQRATDVRTETLMLLLHGIEVLVQLLLALVVLPFFAVFGEILVEATFALVTDVLSEDGLEGPQATGCVDVSNNADHDHGRSLHDGHGLNHFFLVHLSRSVDLADDVGHAGLVAQEGSQVHGLAGVILGEALGLTPVTTTPLAGQEAQRSVTRSRKLSVRLLGRNTCR
uniref:Uncharacterized protein n=1 Tax=Cyclopterus lumpus TaxID=8103 RepID=A0A8C2YVI3_CYCLU